MVAINKPANLIVTSCHLIFAFDCFVFPDPPDQLRVHFHGVERQVPLRVLLPGGPAGQLPSPGHGRDRQGHGLEVREHRGGRGRVRREGDRLLHQPGQEGGHLRGGLGQDQPRSQEGGLRQDRGPAQHAEEGQGGSALRGRGQDQVTH